MAKAWQKERKKVIHFDSKGPSGNIYQILGQVCNAMAALDVIELFAGIGARAQALDELNIDHRLTD